MGLTIEETLEDAILALLNDATDGVVAAAGEAATLQKPFRQAVAFDVLSQADAREAARNGDFARPVAFVGRPLLTPADEPSQLMTDIAQVAIVVVNDAHGTRASGARGVTGTYALTRAIKRALRGQTVNFGALTTPPVSMPMRVARTEFFDDPEINAGLVVIRLLIPADTETEQPY